MCSWGKGEEVGEGKRGVATRGPGAGEEEEEEERERPCPSEAQLAQTRQFLSAKAS